MKHIVKRWDGDDLDCGQYSVAMATDKPMLEVYGAVGRRGASNTKMLLEALMRLGFEYEEVTPEQAHVGRGIAIIEDKMKMRGHAVAWEDAKVYDPDGDEFYSDITAMIRYYEKYNMRNLTIIRVKPVQFREFEVGGRENAEV